MLAKVQQRTILRAKVRKTLEVFFRVLALIPGRRGTKWMLGKSLVSQWTLNILGECVHRLRYEQPHRAAQRRGMACGYMVSVQDGDTMSVGSVSFLNRVISRFRDGAVQS